MVLYIGGGGWPSNKKGEFPPPMNSVQRFTTETRYEDCRWKSACALPTLYGTPTIPMRKLSLY